MITRKDIEEMKNKCVREHTRLENLYYVKHGLTKAKFDALHSANWEALNNIREQYEKEQKNE